MPLKILQLFNRFPWPLKDGGAYVNFYSLKGYSDAGCQMTAGVLNTSKHYIKFNNLPDFVKKLAAFYLVDIDNRVKPVPAILNLFSGKSYHIQRFESKAFCLLLKQLCQQYQFDIVVFETIFMAPYLNIIKSHSNAICILRAHNVEHEIWQTQANIEKNPLKKTYLKLLAKRLKKYELNCLNQFDAILTITKNDKLSFERYGAKVPMHIMPAGIEVQQYVDVKTTQIVSFYHLGSMDWMPNQEAVLWFINQVWPEIHAQYPNLTFTVAGRNMPDYFFSINKPGVNIIGEVEDAFEFVSRQGVMIVPLFSGSGMRVKIIEGMAMGKCIISTPLGAQGIDVTHNHDILIASNKSEFIEHMIKLIKQPQLIGIIGENARNTAFSKYNNQQIINETLNFYNSLINKTK